MIVFRILTLCGIMMLLAVWFAPICAEVKEEFDPGKFSRKEIRWAVKWINSELSYLMGNGVLKQISTKNKTYKVFIGEPWHELEFHQKGDFLTKLSRSREITGHSPFFQVYDGVTKELVARITEHSISVFLVTEGFFAYLEDASQKENTWY
ncbi:MAG: hypothetical protein GY868_16335 [Deltaproteobacteria bacterium]|nr:hypothetical protein [Deltaproteobacteria bacterium]